MLTDPSVASLIAQRLDDLRDDVQSVKRDFSERLDRIEVQTSKTNGRVGKVELAQARIDGMRAAYKWIGPLLGSLFCGTGGTLITLALTGKIG